MAKMLRLIQNEYIKTFRKLSTKIIFILIIVCAAGLVGISKYAEKTINEYYSEMMSEEDDYDYSYEIQSAEEMKSDGYEFDIAQYRFMQDNKINWFGWKGDACNQLFEYTVSDNGTAEYVYSEDTRKELERCIISNDWRGYCEQIVSAMKAAGLSEESYWEYQYRIDHDIALPDSYSETSDWKNSVISEISAAKTMIASMEVVTAEDAKDKAHYEETVTLGMYRLENNVEINVADCESIFDTEDINFWTVFCTSSSLVQIIGLLIIVITGSALASEFSQGTIKFLLINPVKRWKILVSKYIMSITLGYIMLLMLYIISALLSIMFFGTSQLGAEYLEVVDDSVRGTSGFLYVLQNYMLGSVNLVVMATLAFAISSLIRSSSLAIGVSLFAMLSGNTIVLILKQALNQDWARYLIFANTDLAAVANGSTGFSHHSMLFAATVVAVHLIVFFMIAWDGFIRREI